MSSCRFLCLCVCSLLLLLPPICRADDEFNIGDAELQSIIDIGDILGGLDDLRDLVGKRRKEYKRPEIGCNSPYAQCKKECCEDNGGIFSCRKSPTPYGIPSTAMSCTGIQANEECAGACDHLQL